MKKKPKGQRMKITSLQIENVKRVKALRLEPSPQGLTVIGGKNRQGKTSVLDAIAAALGGATLQTCYHDGGTWRRANTLLEEIAADDLKRFFLLARRASCSKTRTNRRKTYLSGLDILFATLVQG